MFRLGFIEIVIILLVVLVFIKPDELPKFFLSVGRLYGRIVRQAASFRKIINEDIQDVQGDSSENK